MAHSAARRRAISGSAAVHGSLTATAQSSIALASRAAMPVPVVALSARLLLFEHILEPYRVAG